MRLIRGRVREARRAQLADSGAVAVMVALLMVVLVGAAALAVDLGRARLVAAQVQKAADAAALAGAAYLPDDLAGARAAAVQVAQANLAVGLAGAPSVTADVGATPTRLQVRVSAPMSYAFGPVLGIGGTDVVRSAVAEVAGPAALLGTCNVLGREDMAPGTDPTQAPVADAACGGVGPSWLLASGAATNSGLGDAYGSALCTTPGGIEGCSTPASSATDPGTNATYDPAGTTYTVQVDRTGALDLQGYDLAWVATGAGCTEHLQGAADVTNPYVPTAADAAARYGTGAGPGCAGDTQPAWPDGDLTAVRTVVTVRGPSASVLDPAAGPVLCTLDLDGWGDGYAAAAGPLDPTPARTAPLRLARLLDAGAPTYQPVLAQYFHRWAPVCPSTLTASPGTYTIQVQTVGGGGQNRYALRATLDGVGDGVTVAATGHVATVTPIRDGTAVPVVRVGAGDAGRTVTVRTFALGTAGAPVVATVLGPDGAGPTDGAPLERCQDLAGDPLAPCVVTGAAPVWQGLRLAFPVDHACPAEDDPARCWLAVGLQAPAGTEAVVTWEAYANGNAVRLVP